MTRKILVNLPKPSLPGGEGHGAGGAGNRSSSPSVTGNSMVFGDTTPRSGLFNFTGSQTTPTTQIPSFSFSAPNVASSSAHIPAQESKKTAEKKAGRQEADQQTPPPAQIPSFSFFPTSDASSSAQTPARESKETVEKKTDGQEADEQLINYKLSASFDSPSVGHQDPDASSPLTPRTTLSPSGTPRRPRDHRRRSSSRVDPGIHRVEDEVPPTDRFNNPLVQNAFRDAKQSMKDLAAVLNSSSLQHEPGSVIEALSRQATSLAGFQCPSKRTVGFVGGTGVGKSSLLNCLLDCRDLARADNAGQACTCVVTEYHFHEGSGPRKFAIEVDYFTRDGIEAQLKNLLQDYRHFHLDRDSLESQEIKDLEGRAGIALHTFQAIFRGLLVNTDMLTSDSEYSVLESFRSWLQRVAPSIIDGKQYMSTLKECSTLLMSLSSEVTSKKSAAVWPWIRKIKVYVDSHTLRQGLILVDLPGLLDANSARRNITERYLLECDEIFVVCDEGRATDDIGVQNVIELAKQVKLSNVGIICTKSDLVKAQEASKNFDGTKAEEFQRKLEAFDASGDDIKQLKENIESFDEIEGELTHDEITEITDLHKSLRSAEKRRNQHGFEVKQFLIMDRNATVESKLLQQYKEKVPGNTLKVFCVSSELYKEHRKDPKDVGMRWLNLSGILAVRRHCYTMVSESQYAAARRYIRDEVAVVLGGVNLWVQSGQETTLDKKARIRDTLNVAEKNLNRGLCGSTSKINSIASLFSTNFRAKVPGQDDAEVKSWHAAAIRASEDWMSVTTYHAFCGRYGDWETRAVGRHVWNEEMIEKMVGFMVPSWGALSSNLDREGECTLDIVDDFFGQAERYLEDNLNGSARSNRFLTSTLMSHKRVLKADIETIFHDFRKRMSHLSRNALSGHRTSFIGSAMEEAYRSAGLQSGTGRHARQKNIINSAIRRHDLFQDLLKDVEKAFNGHTRTAQEKLEEAVKTHLICIADSFDIIRGDNAAEECEKNWECRKRVEEALQLAETEMNRVRTSIEGMDD